MEDKIKELITRISDSKRAISSVAIEDALEFMKKHGQSVVLNWGEDNNLWECGWITSGERLTGFSSFIHYAIKQVLEKTLQK